MTIGPYADAESRLHTHTVRDYDPSLGRYVESDPTGLAGGLNTYAYAGGNPLVYVDRFGLESGVIIWHPVGYGKSSFGHASAYVGNRSYSYGPNGMDSRPLDRYLGRNNFRGGLVIPLNLSGAQEEAFASCLSASQGDYDLFGHNCTDPIERCLGSIGADLGGSLTPQGLAEGIVADPDLYSRGSAYPIRARQQSRPQNSQRWEAPWAR